MKTSFFKIVFATITGLVIFSILTVVIWVALLFVAGASSHKKEEVEPNSVLLLKLNKPIVEHSVSDFKFNFLDLKNSGTIALDDVIDAIDNAAKNPDIKGIFLELTAIQGSYAQIDAIRNALEKFKQSGKWIIAHSDTYIQPTYYLASVADKIYLTPTGNIIWKGLSSQIMYYKTALEKAGIEPVVIRHGKYKSAVEPFMQDTISPANREQISKLLNAFWNNILKKIAQARNIETNMLNLYADSLMISTSEKALQFNFVDNLKFRNDVIDEIREMLALKKDDKVNFVNYNALLDELPTIKKRKIAVIYAEGGIVDGKKSQNNKIVSNYYAKLIKKVRQDSSVKAVVIRVNSPGGSALASEVILNEILKTKKVKPVIISIGQYAASGGHYISCSADYIYAEPFTVTGSIGVLGLFFNVKPLMHDKLGLSVNTVKTNEYADALTPFRHPDSKVMQVLKGEIENIYQVFIKHVAEGRNLRVSYVDSIGQGRVWSAPDALDLGLIDEVGYLQDAIDKAVNIAGLSNKKYSIVEYPKKKNFLEQITEDLKNDVSILKTFYFANENPYKYLTDKLKTYEGIQARLFWDLEIE